MLTCLPWHEPFNAPRGPAPLAVSIALVTTVKNEADLLRRNLLYHRRLGVDRCYVFDDGSADGTAESVADLDFVEVSPSVAASHFESRTDMEAYLRPDPYQARRQGLNCAFALDLAREAGFDWLVHLDADELLCPQLESAPAGALSRLLGGVDASVEMVVFVVIEAIQRGVSTLEALGGTLFRSPNAALARPAQDPFQGEIWNVGHYGHATGKSAVRVAVDSRPNTPHRFLRRNGSELQQVRSGYLAHYYGYNARDFWDKFRALTTAGDRYPLGGRVERRVRVWRDMTRDPRFSEADLADYYERWIRFKDDEIARLSRTRRFGLFPVEPAIIEVTAVREALLELGLLDTPGPAADN
jgi:Glycosyl transferase family 2